MPSKFARFAIASGLCVFAAASWAPASSALAAETLVTFDDQAINAAPKGLTCVLAGRGKPGDWKIKAEGANKMLAQLGKHDRNARYPVCVIDGLSTKDVDLSVKFKPISGEVDRAAGLVWRYQNKDNFYVVRANALEDNVVLYKMHRGRRSDLPLIGKGRTYGAKAKVPNRKWSTLRVTAASDIFTVYLNGRKLYRVKDRTFTKAGGVGVWTKADSVTYFDDLKAVTK